MFHLTFAPRAAMTSAGLALAVLCFGCGSGTPQNAGQEPGANIALNMNRDVVAPVEASHPEVGAISTYLETTTRVEAERRVEISPKATSRVLSVLAEEGDSVKTGQILAELEKDEARAAYNEADVQVRQNRTAYELAKKQFEEGLGPRVEMDNAFYTYEQSRATLETQRIQLENLTIRSPINGVVTSRDINVGMLAAQGTPVYTITDPSSFMLAINPPEKEIPRLRIGQPAEVRVDSMPGTVFSARIRRINPSVDPVTGTVRVILDFDEETREVLFESAFARVNLVMNTNDDALLLPKEAVVEDEGRQYVFVIVPDDSPPEEDAAPDADDPVTPQPGEVLASPRDDSDSAQEPPLVAKRIEVVTGLEDSENIQILRGIEADDLVVTNGQLTLKPDARVRVTNMRVDLLAKVDVPADEALAAAKAKRAQNGQSEDDGGRRRRGRRRPW